MTELAVYFLDDAAERASAGTATDAEEAVAVLGWLTASIERDREAGRFELWGLSNVIDENVGEPVITQSLFEHLHALAGVEATWPIGNAGLVHCYGYLLSLTPTPYGLKRERWLGAGLAQAYGLPDVAFVPWVGEQTLLERAADATRALLEDPALSRTQTIDARQARVTLSKATGSAALAYAVAPVGGGDPLLVTTFPVGDAAAILDEFDATPRLRWNAV